MAIRYKAQVERRSLEKLEKKLLLFRKLASKSEMKKIGDMVVEEMKGLISRGISPIKGKKKRFEKYKNPKKYPGKIKKGKKKRPVNLKLHGDFLDDLQAKEKELKTGASVEIGYFTESERLKELGHREGANDQPKRPTIPQKGEQFAQSIQNLYIEEVRKIVREKIRK